MSANVNPIANRSSSYTSRANKDTPCGTCLLCRVLWPRTLQHRHLDSSSEATTALRAKTNHSK